MILSQTAGRQLTTTATNLSGGLCLPTLGVTDSHSGGLLIPTSPRTFGTFSFVCQPTCRPKAKHKRAKSPTAHFENYN